MHNVISESELMEVCKGMRWMSIDEVREKFGASAPPKNKHGICPFPKDMGVPPNLPQDPEPKGYAPTEWAPVSINQYMRDDDSSDSDSDNVDANGKKIMDAKKRKIRRPKVFYKCSHSRQLKIKVAFEGENDVRHAQAANQNMIPTGNALSLSQSDDDDTSAEEPTTLSIPLEPITPHPNTTTAVNSSPLPSTVPVIAPQTTLPAAQTTPTAPQTTPTGPQTISAGKYRYEYNPKNNSTAMEQDIVEEEEKEHDYEGEESDKVNPNQDKPITRYLSIWRMYFLLYKENMGKEWITHFPLQQLYDNMASISSNVLKTSIVRMHIRLWTVITKATQQIHDYLLSVIMHLLLVSTNLATEQEAIAKEISDNREGVFGWYVECSSSNHLV